MDQETLQYFQSKSTEELTEILEEQNTNIYKYEAFEIIRHILDERTKQSERYMPGYVEEEKITNLEEKDEEIDEIDQLTPPPIPKNEFNTNVELNNPKDTNEKSLESSNGSETFTKQKQRMFSNPFSFEGRIRRAEYGISMIIYFIIMVIVDVMIEYEIAVLFLWLVYIPMMWFIWAQGAKRCHDMGKSGWFQIIPFYVLWMVFVKGEFSISNQYGANLKN